MKLTIHYQKILKGYDRLHYVSNSSLPCASTLSMSSSWAVCISLPLHFGLGHMLCLVAY